MIQDVQNERPEIDLNLDKVGVKAVQYPIVVMDRENDWQETVADISMSVDLPHHFRGTHMSRFIEMLNKHRGKVTVSAVTDILLDMKETFKAETAHIEIEFPYFLEKTAPVSREKSLMNYRAGFIASYGKEVDFVLRVITPVLGLCPCSKEISEYGAHNQRVDVIVNMRMNSLVWIEEIIAVVEDCASSDIYALLKRVDEKYITEQAYDNPRFVEDMVREVADKFNGDERIDWFNVLVESYESIHNHNAFATLEVDKREKGK